MATEAEIVQGIQSPGKYNAIMSYMFEVYYKSPPDPQRESNLSQDLSKSGGRLTFREDPDESGNGAV